MFLHECDVKRCNELDRYVMSKHKNITRFVVGKSTLNRDIVAYTIGAQNGTLMCGAFHGMERMTAAVLYKFLDEVCTNCQKNVRINNLINSRGLTIVPMINPDGVEISIHGADSAGKCKTLVTEILNRERIPHTKWQANARGVDINHNFDAGYADVKKHEISLGITRPSSTRYGGKTCESESETKALSKLCRKNNFYTAVALHTQGREIYYSYKENTPKRSEIVAKSLSRLSGYTLSFPEPIATGGGFKDWFIEHFQRMGFTIEIGKGENPLPCEMFESEYDKVRKMLWYLSLYA